MTERLFIAPSILTADFGRLAEEVQSVAPYVDWFHLDVMDGHYVPNLTFGPSTVAAVRRAVDRPVHVHLMIEDPESYVEMFAEAGADRISFHPEVVENPARVIEKVRERGVGPGLAVHPDVPVGPLASYLPDLDVLLMMTVRPGFGGQKFLSEVVPKIAEGAGLVEKTGARAEIEVDGGVNLDTVVATVEAGARIVVAGSAVFDGKDPVAAARRLRERLDMLEEGIGE